MSDYTPTEAEVPRDAPALITQQQWDDFNLRLAWVEVQCRDWHPRSIEKGASE